MFARFGHLRKGFARKERVIKGEASNNMEEVVYPSKMKNKIEMLKEVKLWIHFRSQYSY